MHPRKRAYLIFSIVYWLVILASLLLFGLSLQKVHLNHYGLRRNYYNSEMTRDIYTSGLYHRELGFYFLEFPSCKIYLENQKSQVINADLQKIELTYTLVYRFRPNYIYDLYSSFAMEYNAQLIGSINSILSNYFNQISQSETRVSVQSVLEQKIGDYFNTKDTVLKQAIQIEGFWLDQLNFFEKEEEYEKAYQDSSSYSQAYQQAQIQLFKTNLKIQSLKTTLQSLQSQLSWQTQKTKQSSYNTLTANSQIVPISTQLFINNQTTNLGRIFQYYPGITLNIK